MSDHNISITLRGGVEVDQDASFTVPDKETIVITVSPGTGYSVTAYKINNTWYDRPMSQIPLRDIRADKNVIIVAQKTATKKIGGLYKRPYTGEITNKYVLAIGDSKTSNGTWIDPISTYLNTVFPPYQWASINKGVSGYTVPMMAAAIDAILESIAVPGVIYILFNLGVNGVVSETDHKTGYQYIIDACKTKFPLAEGFMAYPWAYNIDAKAANIHLWNDDLIGDNSDFICAGHDESVWLKGEDNGATMTIDGWHYSVTGNAECTNQWLSILGF